MSIEYAIDMKINVYLLGDTRFFINKLFFKTYIYRNITLAFSYQPPRQPFPSHDSFHTQDNRSRLRRNRVGRAYPDNAAASDSLAGDDPRNTY